MLVITATFSHILTSLVPYPITGHTCNMTLIVIMSSGHVFQFSKYLCEATTATDLNCSSVSQ